MVPTSHLTLTVKTREGCGDHTMHISPHTSFTRREGCGDHTMHISPHTSFTRREGCGDGSAHLTPKTRDVGITPHSLTSQYKSHFTLLSCEGRDVGTTLNITCYLTSHPPDGRIGDAHISPHTHTQPHKGRDVETTHHTSHGESHSISHTTENIYSTTPY